MKNHTDMLIFHTAICAGASQIATDGRRELDVLVATPSLRSGMEDNMTVQVKAWGKSSAVRIPSEVLNEAGVKREDELDLRVEGSDIILSKTRRHKTLEERIAAYGGKLGIVKDYDWGEPKGRELF